VWGSTDSGITLEQIGTWTQDGNRDPTYGEYEFTSTPLKRNTVFNFRFAGDSEYYAANSQYFPVRIKAHLSTPIVTPRSVERNAAFTIYGYVRPYTPGHTRLTFYRYNPRAREWMFYKALKVPNAEYNGYTKYTRRYRLPDRGDYYVEARRLGDESNAGTTSSKRYFTVQ
jgi:hypothetical protein